MSNKNLRNIQELPGISSQIKEDAVKIITTRNKDRRRRNHGMKEKKDNSGSSDSSD